MNDVSVRKGMTNAHFNEKAFGPVSTEIIAISAVGGLYYESWVVFGAILLGLLVALMVRPLAILLAISISMVWGAVGFFTGSLLGGLNAQITIGGIAFLCSLGFHLAATEYARDIGGVDKQ